MKTMGTTDIKISEASKASLIKTLQELMDYACSSSAYLSERTDYARGYKEGIGIVKQIISDIIEENIVIEG